MAIFVNRLTTATANDKDCHAVSVWSVNATSYDASAGEIALASPGPGFQLALTRLTICCGAAITATLLDDVDVLIGPLGGSPGTYSIDRTMSPILLGVDHKLAVITSGGGDIGIIADGYVRKI